MEECQADPPDAVDAFDGGYSAISSFGEAVYASSYPSSWYATDEGGSGSGSEHAVDACPLSEEG